MENWTKIHNDWLGEYDRTLTSICESAVEIALADNLDPRPCNGRNSNVCVAEGCYGEACLDLPARPVLFPVVWEGDYA